MENVESDPKTDRPKVHALGEQRGRSGSAGKARGPVASRQPGSPAPAPLQEEIRIDSTTVFVDPFEEADAQVRRVQLPHGEGLGGVMSGPRGCGPAATLLRHRLPRSGRRHSSRRQPQRAQ